MLSSGSTAPDFTLSDQHGVSHALSSARGKWLVLYFYPKDETSGCTTEACGFRDASADFAKRNCLVWGVSADDAASHMAFAGNHSLQFPLLADTHRNVISAYGAGEHTPPSDGKSGIKRVSYLIDPHGMIVKTYPDVTPASHPRQVLADLDARTPGR